MKPFVTLTAIAAPVEIAKIDTGMILPGRYMRRHRRPGHDYSEAFLHDLRFDEKEQPRADFSLNQPAYQHCEILVTDADFGCGSSREGAAYAVLDFGLRALIGPSFGDIFYANCLQNGVLPIVLPYPAIHALWRQLRATPGATITIDLPAQSVIAPDGSTFDFEINALRKQRLIDGVDDIDVTLGHIEAIRAFEEARQADMPWLPTSG
ncbi:MULTISPECIES: 3-isopropylmalate dehydratase small subunit [Burkholderiaceae]|uniref:3-isopropylmalate dehydratase small subunit n=1 Tax=Burkholderiaceae TaxID=119060 RepID=UPI00141EFB45|nr:MULTISPECIES: 3-isopropylmalate dehydratase small subunit [Burkholderiaceae]MBN3845533.1 3-isopropylmalate dehydratase small subunit [Paraburkholderia sp. Ac-20342]NIF50972.1 3-isopropylmalate dehydratase small subunit [Burkholderia sp. Ax-1724]NIF75807.1 3-isopropylmalate dehydratase small subunit [Paraburkholderia sp. Cy-641]